MAGYESGSFEGETTLQHRSSLLCTCTKNAVLSDDIAWYQKIDFRPVFFILCTVHVFIGTFVSLNRRKSLVNPGRAVCMG